MDLVVLQFHMGPIQSLYLFDETVLPQPNLDYSALLLVSDYMCIIIDSIFLNKNRSRPKRSKEGNVQLWTAPFSMFLASSLTVVAFKRVIIFSDVNYLTLEWHVYRMGS